jgi:hypothetical protein
VAENLASIVAGRSASVARVLRQRKVLWQRKNRSRRELLAKIRAARIASSPHKNNREQILIHARNRSRDRERWRK